MEAKDRFVREACRLANEEGDQTLCERENCPWYGEPDGCNHPTGYRDDAPYGNAAAMREALERIRSAMIADSGMGPTTAFHALVDELTQAALSEPARNCDVGTAEEQKARHDRFCSRHYKAECVDSQCFGCPAHEEKTETDCEFVWGQLPYSTEDAQ